MRPTALLMALATAFVPVAAADLPPIATVDRVDLPRYMGNWYVIANIPPRIEKGAHNSVENYRLEADGDIATVFTYRKGSFAEKVSTLKSTGIVKNAETKAEWGIRFVWPFTAEYLIAYLDADYTRAIVARNKRDYVWLMARTPEIAEEEYESFKRRIAAMGYDVAKLEKVPQKWPDEGRVLLP